MDQAEWKLLKEIAELEKTPQGAYNIRRNGALDSRNSTANIEITTKTEPGKSGIDIRIKPGTRHESVHIPVIISQTGLSEMVYNDFFIGEDCDVDIVAGCGIHNTGCETSQHDGVHTFYVGKNSKVRYVERHYGEGPGTGKRIMNPQTVVYLEEGATINLESTQIRGVDSTKRETKIVVGKDAEAIITEKLLTHGEQTAESDMEIILDGEGANGRVVSRSVAQDQSRQVFYPKVTGNARCFGHVQCDSIIMGDARISSIPAIVANHVDAQLIHEAAIGRIAGDQILKLMTLGLTEQEARRRFSMDSYSKLLELVNTSGCFAPANHMYVTELRPDHSAVGVLEVQPSSLNPMGIVHGGALVTLADTVCGTAAFTTGHMCVTLDCSMQYLAPASGARITCTATPRKLGKTVLVYEAVLTDDTGRTVATGVYTFFAKGPAN